MSDWIDVNDPPEDGTYCVVCNQAIDMIGLAFYADGDFMVESDFKAGEKYSKLFADDIAMYLPFDLPRED